MKQFEAFLASVQWLQDESVAELSAGRRLNTAATANED